MRRQNHDGPAVATGKTRSETDLRSSMVLAMRYRKGE